VTLETAPPAEPNVGAADIAFEASRRRTFAIISHPDAGKTTLTEKFLLYAGAVGEAGAVKAREGRRRSRSDWMELEQQRGISVTSTALKFSYRDHIINLLDTPGHRDFSEDTYRVLTAADAAVMVLDVAKGIEPQTLKLFEVCKAQQLPILTFLNKYDRPGRDPLELLDEIESQIGLRPTPVTWPVGIPGSFKGVIDRRDGSFVRYTRSVRGATEAGEEIVAAEIAEREEGEDWTTALEGCALLDEVEANIDLESFYAGESSPLFVGSALTNFGVRHLLDAVVDLAPSPHAHHDVNGDERPISAAFSGFVFKVQANMNPAHRDHIAFLRVCSGRFERGLTVTASSTGRPFATKYATSLFGADRSTIEDAFPGDVVGLVNASDLKIGESLYLGERVTYPPIPSFAPELFATVRNLDTSRYKQFRRGLEQLTYEGVIQTFTDPLLEGQPVLGAVGQLQLEVAEYRLAHEFKAPIEMRTAEYQAVRRTDSDTVAAMPRSSGIRIVRRGEDLILALFESEYWLQRLQRDHPEWTLEPIVTLDREG
jgi:peptide chain release factor 3